MHIDARTLENNTLIEGDICIVGAGAAGISIAREWINTPYKIILLEGGGFDYDEKVQELYDGKLTGQKYYPMMSSRLHYFGGTTGHWGGLCSQLDEFDFQKRDWVPESGWPINRKDLEDQYQRAYQILDLEAQIFDKEYWKKTNPDALTFPFQKSVIYNKVYQASLPTRFGQKYKDLITEAPNIFLHTYANAVEIESNAENTTINSIKIKNYAGKTHQVKAKRYILACSALQNARLLLSSKNSNPQGLGNNHDLVGRYFMEHLEIKTGEVWLNQSNALKLYSWKSRRRVELALSALKQKELKILNGSISLSELMLQKKTKASINVWSEKDPRKSLDQFVKFASQAYHKTRMERLFASSSPNAYGMYTRMEQSPNPSSRVILDTELDSLGMPKVILNWDFNEIDKKSIREINKCVGQQFGLAGIGRTKIYDFLWDDNDDSMTNVSGGWHHMGTTRMSEDPKRGVVDKNCKVHSFNNLFVAGSSCFVTSGATPPTLTVVALSLRLSDYLKKQI